MDGTHPRRSNPAQWLQYFARSHYRPIGGSRQFSRPINGFGGWAPPYLQVAGFRAGFPLKSKQGFPGEALFEFTGGFSYWFLLIKKQARGPDAVFSDMPTLDKLAYIDWMRGKMLEIVRREFAAVTDGTLRFHLRRFLRAWFAYSGMLRRWYESELFMEL